MSGTGKRRFLIDLNIVSDKTVRNQILALMIAALTVGNYAILNSNDPHDVIVRNIIILSIYAITCILITILVDHFTKNPYTILTLLLSVGVTVYILTCLFYFERAGIIQTVILTWLILMFLNIHFNLGIMIIVTIHILTHLYYLSAFSNHTMLISKGYYILNIVCSFLVILYVYFNYKIYERYHIKIQTQLNHLETQNDKLTLLNKELIET